MLGYYDVKIKLDEIANDQAKNPDQKEEGMSEYINRIDDIGALINTISLINGNYHQTFSEEKIRLICTRLRVLLGLDSRKSGGAKSAAYKKTARKYTDTKGNKYTIYTKNDKDYIKKLSKSTGKFTYRPIK